jgi:hemolysin activation/secretion protein
MLYYNLKNEQHVFNQVTAAFSYFTKVILFPETVFAFRVGAAYNAGEYDLIRANTLGGKSNLRGFRDGRFTGDKTLYFNSELRMKLSNVKSYITKGYFGILTFYDLGRLWYSGEVSRLWHQGYGAGLWVSPYEMAIVTINYERSYDEQAGFITIRFGFFF